MSYKIEPMAVNSFLEYPMQLPRFQRKSTWKNDQNFELCISIFQDYPVGVVIVNKEQKISWLLDGRQRRNALKLMRENPVNIYNWAKSYIKFKNNDDVDEIKKKYWEKVNEYLQSDPTEAKQDSEDEEYTSESTNSYDEEDSFSSLKQKQGLQTLLDLILMNHQIKSTVTKWERLFNFNEFSNRTFASEQNPIKLRSNLLGLIKDTAVERDSEGHITKESAIEYFRDLYVVNDDKFPKFKDKITNNWNEMNTCLDAIEKSEKVFADARIGVIWLTNASPLDALNIFSRINSGGTQLKAEELLSAKPYWNVPVESVDEELVEIIKTLYKKMNLTQNNIVRWDLAATLLERIDKGHLLFSSGPLNPDEKEEINLEAISLGFKLISSIKKEGMSAESVNSLETLSADKFNWNREIRIIVEDYNNIIRVLGSNSFFKYLQSWKQPIIKLIGNAPVLEFAAILYKDWYAKNQPISPSKEQTQFIRDAKILFDRLIFEYATKAWRGSSDSKMSNDIKSWNNRLEPIPEEEWERFIQNACNGKYNNGQDITYKNLAPVLYYYYILVGKSPIISGDIVQESFNTGKFHVDHIYPQEKLTGNSLISENKDSLYNLCLLPGQENKNKSKKALKEITDPWLKQYITHVTGINEDDFVKYSDLTNLEDLKRLREEMFIVAFTKTRMEKLTNL